MSLRCVRTTYSSREFYAFPRTPLNKLSYWEGSGGVFAYLSQLIEIFAGPLLFHVHGELYFHKTHSLGCESELTLLESPSANWLIEKGLGLRKPGLLLVRGLFKSSPDPGTSKL